jgi:hypothetical protein
VARRDLPAIVPAEGGVVDGVLYLDVDDADLARLDAYRGRAVRAPRGPGRAAATASGAAPGASLAAGAYVWRRRHRARGHAWDSARFEREAIDAFIASYCASRGVG